MNPEPPVLVVLFVNVGRPGPVESRLDPSKPFESAIVKEPVEGPIRAQPLGLDGDGQADLRHHGGPDQAVCGYPSEHLAAWRDELGLEMTPGAFGENLTVSGVDETDVCIGDVFADPDGSLRLQVTQARIPCWKLAHRWGRADLPERVRETRRTGWYFRVLVPGPVTAGTRLVLHARMHPDWPVERADRAYHQIKDDPATAWALAELAGLSRGWRGHLHRALGFGDYNPMACATHDLLEDAAVRRTRLTADLLGEGHGVVTGQITALPTVDGAEYAEFDHVRWIRLDRLGTPTRSD